MEYISQGKQIHRTITDNSALASVDNIVTLPGKFLLVWSWIFQTSMVILDKNNRKKHWCVEMS